MTSAKEKVFSAGHLDAVNAAHPHMVRFLPCVAFVAEGFFGDQSWQVDYVDYTYSACSCLRHPRYHACNMHTAYTMCGYTHALTVCMCVKTE